jgi:hypothetical protein
VLSDINIYNTMGRRSFAPTPGGGGWVPGSQGTMQLGPVINAWVDPVANPGRNIELDWRSQGKARVALKVKTLDSCPVESGFTGTCYRYDYAAQNFDFAASTTGGTPPNLSVAGALGFNRFRIALPARAQAFLPPGADFADIDIDAGNNWTGAVVAGGVEWQAPAGNTLDWGRLFRFSFISNAAPDTTTLTQVTLTPANSALADPLSNPIVGPEGLGNEIMKDGFDAN